MVKKKLYLPALVLALVIALTVFVGAYDFNYVVDDAELLTADEKADVEAYYDRIYTEDNLLLVLVTAYGKGDVLSALPDYADGATDMLLLYVDMDARHFDLYQYNGVSGESAFRVNSSETDTILDAVLNYAADGDWYGAALCFADESLPAFTNDANFISGKDHYGDEGYQEYEKPGESVTWPYNYVIDDAELLTADEKADVEAYYDRIYTEDNLLLVLVTAYGKGDVLSALPDYADGATDMLLLYVDMDARHFDLYQYNGVSGESAFRVNSSETDTILDAVLNYAADGDWYGAALCFADESLPAFTNDANFISGKDHYGDEGYQEYEKPDGPVTWQYKLELIGGIAVGILPIALIISLIVTLIVLASYKKKVRGATYPLEAFTNVKLTASQDNFINKTLTVTTIHRDNDSGGSSGGSSGGGGGGGGGGGHMGGRSF